MNTLPWDVAIALGKRADDEGTRAHLQWLQELHSKTWGRGELGQQLFREREVTKDLYYALQDRLKQKNQDRDSPQYNGYRHNVLSDKLEILQLTNPRHPVDNKDREGDGYSDVHPLFPDTLKYLDLSSLELKYESGRFPSPVLLRKEYDHISKLIDGLPRSGDGSAVVSGQPGTGEPLVSPSRSI